MNFNCFFLFANYAQLIMDMTKRNTQKSYYELKFYKKMLPLLSCLSILLNEMAELKICNPIWFQSFLGREYFCHSLRSIGCMVSREYDYF